MRYMSIEVTVKDHPIIILSSTSINYLFYPYSRVDNMAIFHLPGDPYFPNQGNGGWIDAEPEENHEIPLDDEFEENFPKDSNSEPGVNDLPLVAPIPNPNHRPAFQGPTPLWAENLGRWSQEQGQPLPYDGDEASTI